MKEKQETVSLFFNHNFKNDQILILSLNMLILRNFGEKEVSLYPKINSLKRKM